MQHYTLPVNGTHCASCKILIEDILQESPAIARATVNLKKKTITIKTNHNLSQKSLTDLVIPMIAAHGYTVGGEIATVLTPPKFPAQLITYPLGLLVLYLFYLLQKSGLLNFGFSESVTPVTSFIIGLVASVSSCLAVVGGLVLSLSTQQALSSSQSTKNIALFHLSRLFSFAILGGLLGGIGRLIGINSTVSTLLGITAAIVMIALSFNLLGLFTKNFITLPPSLFRSFKKLQAQSYAPILLGAVTFFLPCGFTQSMQVVALASGSFLSGAFIMLAFALGTFPVLSLLSFGSARISQSKYAPIFFQSIGVVILGLGLFALLSGLTALGIIQPAISI